MPTSKTALRRRYIRFYGQCIQRRLDDMLTAFASRPLETAYSYVYLDARYERVREDGVVRSQAVFVALGVDERGHRAVLALGLSMRK